MATNPAAKMVGALITRGVVPVLKPLGFKRSGTTFRRELDECIQVVNVQSSQWNDRDHARFTINLGIYFPAVEVPLADFLKSSLGESGPRASQCHLRQRIGGVLQTARDLWWTLRPGEPAASVVTEVEAALRGPAMQWFERNARPTALLSSTELVTRASVLGAALLAGNDAVARQLAHEFLDDSPEETELREWLVARGLVDA